MAEKMRKRGDITGFRSGYLEAIRKVESRKTSGGHLIAVWECKCDCGRITYVDAGKIRNKTTRSCGQCGLMGPSHELDDLVGREFGFLTVVGRVENHISSGGNSFVAWDCQCDCGEHIIVTSGHLKTYHIMSCGKCGKFDRSIDFSGKHIGRLTVIERSDEWYAYPNGDRDFKWICKCDCGRMTVTRGNVLRDKRFIHSCGCWRSEITVRDEDMLDHVFNGCKVLSKADRIKVGPNNTVDAWNCECQYCGAIFVARGPQLRFGKIVSCGCKSLSHWELWMSQFLDEHHFTYSSQKMYEGLYGVGGGHLFYDFCLSIENSDVLIECQGLQHYQPVDYFGGDLQFEKQVEHDNRKRKYAFEHNIPLIELNCSKIMSRDEYYGLIDKSLAQYVDCIL